MTAPNELPEEPRRYMVVFRPVSMSRASGEADMEPSETGGWVKLSDYGALRSAYDAKAREIGGLRKDAERYRWIKSAPSDVLERLAWTADDFDAAVDAARSEGSK